MRRYFALTLSLGIILAFLAAACGDDDDAADTPTDDEVLTAVTQALVEKNGWDPADVQVTLQTIEDGKYAMGGVRDVPGPGGGLWFAALVDGDWRIVWDGNGIIDCTSLEPYPEFPASLIPTCTGSDGGLQQR